MIGYQFSQIKLKIMQNISRRILNLLNIPHKEELFTFNPLIKCQSILYKDYYFFAKLSIKEFN